MIVIKVNTFEDEELAPEEAIIGSLILKGLQERLAYIRGTRQTKLAEFEKDD